MRDRVRRVEVQAGQGLPHLGEDLGDGARDEVRLVGGHLALADAVHVDVHPRLVA